MMTAPLDTPVGQINLGATERGFHMLQLPRRGPGDYPFIASGPYDAEAAAHLGRAREQLEEYFEGTRTEFTLELDWTGVSGLRLTVLKLLAEIPFGATTTYGELAAGAGQPQASQAVGGIMGSNPMAIVVPCHRVLAADGLGGFGGGLRLKEWLLAWEGSAPPHLW